MKIFYVYEHWRPDTDVCFYVGKGKRSRAFKFHDRNLTYKAIADALAGLGMCIEVRMVASGLTEKRAFAIERDRIAFWRSLAVSLANRTDGGEGHSGFIRPLGIRLSQAAKNKLSASRTGIKFSDEHRAKLAAKKLGRPRKPFTEETRALMRAAATAREAEKRRLFGPDVRRNSRIKESV